MTRGTPMLIRSLLATGLLCGLLASPVASALAAGDPVLVIGVPPETLDPYNTNTTLTTAVTKSFYEGLFEFDKDLKVRNVLAESYEVSPDGLTYTFKLREGVKFHDGTAFDANAVKANLERVLNPENRLARYNQFNRVKTVEVVSPFVVRITLKEPFGPFINSLAHASAAMISPAALQKWGKDIAFHPVGTGPFTFVEWKQTDSVKGAKFAGYWQAGLPKVDAITWKPVPENGTRAAMLQTGEADFAFPLPYEQAKSLGENKKLKVIAQDSIIERYVSMNMLQKPFDDLRVRQAINYAINKEALAKVAFSGYASPAKGIVPAGVLYAHPMNAWPYDPAKARQLLKEAGYANGFETTCGAPTPPAPRRRRSSSCSSSSPRSASRCRPRRSSPASASSGCRPPPTRRPPACACTMPAGRPRPARPTGPCGRSSPPRPGRPSSTTPPITATPRSMRCSPRRSSRRRTTRGPSSTPRPRS